MAKLKILHVINSLELTEVYVFQTIEIFFSKT